MNDKRVALATGANQGVGRGVSKELVAGALALQIHVTDTAMLPLLRKSSGALTVNVSSGVGSPATNTAPNHRYHAQYGPI